MRKLPALLAVSLAVATLGLPPAALANGYDFYPPPLAWSPDSSLLLAAWPFQFPLGEGGSSGPAGELRLYFPETGRHELAAFEYSASPCWHPDGKSFAAVVNGRLSYFLLDSSGGGARPVRFGSLSPRGDVLDCCFSPLAGEQSEPMLYFSAGERFYGADIFTWSPALQAEEFITLETGTALNPLPLADGSLVYLVQGDYTSDAAYERIAYQTSSAAPPAWTRPRAQGPEISPEEYHECYPIPIPGTSRLIFQRGGWGDWDLFTLDLDTGAEELLLADAQQPSLSADGSRLLFTRRAAADKAAVEYDWELPSSVWVKDLSSGAEHRLSAEGFYAEGPAISPDGCHAAWLESPEDGGMPAGGHQEGEQWPPPYPAVKIVMLDMLD